MARREPAVRAARAARASRAPRPGASRASAARARCSSTARWCARASCSRPPRSSAEIVTVEGLQPGERGALTDVQRAFVEAGAVQCGFCTPGLVMAVHDLLDRDPAPDDLAVREAISGNLCRCTGYGRILAAVARVAVDALGAPVMSVDDTRAPTRTSAGGIGERAIRPDGGAQGARRVRVRRRPLGRGHAVGPDAALAAPVGPHPLASTSGPRSRSPACTRCSPPTTCPVATATASSTATSRCSPATSSATRASRSPPSPPTIPRPRGGRARRSSSTTRCSTRSSTPTLALDAPPLHPDGNVFRDLVHPPRRSRRAAGPVVVEGTYEIGMQDQAFMGPEAGLAIPADDGGVDLDRVDPVAAQRPRPGGRVPRPARPSWCGSPSAASAARSAPART